MKYTRHNLTDAQCKRLAQLYAGIPHNHGTAMGALVRKGLVKDGDGKYPTDCCKLTIAGSVAITLARKEGW